RDGGSPPYHARPDQGLVLERHRGEGFSVVAWPVDRRAASCAGRMLISGGGRGTGEDQRPAERGFRRRRRCRGKGPGLPLVVPRFSRRGGTSAEAGGRGPKERPLPRLRAPLPGGHF